MREDTIYREGGNTVRRRVRENTVHRMGEPFFKRRCHSSREGAGKSRSPTEGVILQQREDREDAIHRQGRGDTVLQEKEAAR